MNAVEKELRRINRQMELALRYQAETIRLLAERIPPQPPVEESMCGLCLHPTRVHGPEGCRHDKDICKCATSRDELEQFKSARKGYRCRICTEHNCVTCHERGDRCPCAREGRT